VALPARGRRIPPHGRALRSQGDLDGAAGLLRQGLSPAAEAGDEPAAAYYLEALAAAGAQLQASGSGWLHGYVPRAPHDHSIEAELRSRMGDAACEQASAHGRSLTGTRATQHELEHAQKTHNGRKPRIKQRPVPSAKLIQRRSPGDA
jgi:hypothetical protein